MTARPARAAALVLALTSVIVVSGAEATVARAQPAVGIVRPDTERGLSPRELGAQLYAGNCAGCHGIDGRGVTGGAAKRAPGGGAGQGPSLRGVGALAPDFYLRTGYMPLGRPDEQPSRSRPRLTDREIRAVVVYIASLQGGPPIPTPHPERGSTATGLRLFTEHCAGCHQVVAQGGVVTGARVPPLEDATPTQVAEAVRLGPYLMPKFSKKQITDAQLDSIIAYVQLAKHPVDRGGWGIGNLGPFPEGMVTWLLGAVTLVAVCMVIGKRLRA